MVPDMGELIVGASLKVIEKCDVVDYNARPPGGKLEGLEELDVVGLKFKKEKEEGTAFLCEVTTHIRGLLYKDLKHTIATIRKKHERQKRYANTFLKIFTTHKFMFWSPVVPKGFLTDELNKIEGLDLVINNTYTKKIEELKAEAKELTHNVNNPFFRSLQILEHLKK